MQYYKEMKQVNMLIENLLKDITKGKTSYSLEHMVIFITTTYEISPSYVRKRIKSLIETGYVPGLAIRKDGMIITEGVDKHEKK